MHDKHAGEHDGWDLIWTSKEDCNAETHEKFQFSIEADCDKSVKEEAGFTWIMNLLPEEIVSLAVGAPAPAPAAAAPAPAPAPAAAPAPAPKPAAAAPAPAPAPGPVKAAAPVCKRQVQYNGPEICKLFSLNA